MNTQATVAPPSATTDDIREIVTVAREFAVNELLPRTLELDLDADRGDLRSVCWEGVCGIGLQRALLGERAGGVDLPLTGLLGIVEELATGDAGIAAQVLLSNVGFALLADERAGARAADARLTVALLPEGVLPDAPGMRVDAGTANGRAPFVLGAVCVDAVVVCDRDHAWKLDGGDEAVRLDRDTAQLGLRAAPAAALELAGATARPLGGADAAAFARVAIYTGVAAIARGIARRAHAIALEYAENRYQGGSMIVEYGAIRDMLARISERNRAVAAPAMFANFSSVTAGAAVSTTVMAEALAIKAAATDAAVASTIDAVQVFGGMGYMHETGAEKLMRDAKYCQLYPAANWLVREDLMALDRQC